MNNYTTTPVCAPSNTTSCAVVGIEEISSPGYQINIFPNPANKDFTIETMATEKQSLKLFGLHGNLLFSDEFTGKTNFDVSTFSEGVYNLAIKKGGDLVYKKLIIVR